MLTCRRERWAKRYPCMWR